MQAAPPSPALGAGVCFETVAPAPSERRHVPQSRTKYGEYPLCFLYFGTILEVFIYATGLYHFTFYIDRADVGQAEYRVLSSGIKGWVWTLA